ncbi:MAG: hypothetical protein ACOYJJ_06800 [Anaerovoracaceae bacterium]|jgi:hypothetical protein
MNRYELEHQLLVTRFFHETGKLMQSIEQKGKDVFTELYRRTDEAAASPDAYSADHFDAGVLEYEDDVIIIRVILPDPEKPSDCSLIYLITDPDYQPYRYLTVELTPDGRYTMMNWTEDGNYIDFGDYDPRQESEIIGNVVGEIFSGAADIEELTRRVNEMRDLLNKYDIDHYEEEVPDFMKMLSVVDELTNGKLTLEERVAAFSEMKDIVRDDDNYVNSHDKIKGMYHHFDDFGPTAGKLDYKEKLFFAFSVYACCNIISEYDEKKHKFTGLAEFDSAETIKCDMEEYWGMEPYMFKVD